MRHSHPVSSIEWVLTYLNGHGSRTHAWPKRLAILI